MKIATHILALSLAILGAGQTAAADTNASKVDSLIAAAADTSVDLRKRIEWLRNASQEDDTGKVMHALARLHLTDPSANGPADAGRWLDRALKREPDNPDYYVTYAEVFWRTGQRENAFSHLKKALALNEKHVAALYWAGKYSAEEMYRNLERTRSTAIYTFALKDGGEMRDAAITYLTRALKADPEHRQARMLLGTIYYEGYKADRLIDLFEEYGARHPEDPDPYFFMGLGYEKDGQLRKAFAEYADGLKRMAPQQKRTMMSAYVLDGEDDETVESYWRRGDPLFLTDVNERLMEHCRRFAYANLTFGESLWKTPGWQTDRGQAYIRYGQPGSRNLRVGVAYLVDTWYYEGFDLSFGNTKPDHWRFLNGRFGNRPVGNLSDVVSRIPQSFRSPYWYQTYDFSIQTAQFRGNAGQTRVEIYYALPGEQVTHSERTPGIHEVDLRRGLFLFGPDWQAQTKSVRPVDLMPWVEVDGIREGYLLGAERMQLGPGRAYLAIEAQDLSGKTFGVARDTLEVRGFPETALDVSELLLARKILERKDGRRGRDAYQILSNPLRRVQRGEGLFFYFEIYNLRRDAYGASHYVITYRVKNVDEEPGEDADWSTAVSDTLQGAGALETHYLSLNMADSAPGVRLFQVTVEDLLAGAEVSAEDRFRVLW